MQAGVANGAFRLADKAFRKLPGGLGIATVVVCAIFAAVSGSSPATVGLKADNPFSDACLIAIDYGNSKIIKEDWKKVFLDEELDRNLEKMLHLDEPIQR